MNCIVTDRERWRTDRQTDRQTDRRTNQTEQFHGDFEVILGAREGKARAEVLQLVQ